MEVIIDSNVLFRTLISQGDILKLFFNPKLDIFAPEALKEEFINNKKEIIEKSSLSEDEFSTLSEILFSRINFIPLENYKLFIPKARLFLGTHEKDEDFVALSLFKNAKIWTYEDLLFKIGLAISTKEISDELSGLN